MISLTDLCDTAINHYRTGLARHSEPPPSHLDRLAGVVLALRLRYASGRDPLPEDARTVAIALLIMTGYARCAPLDDHLLTACLNDYYSSPVRRQRLGPQVWYYCRQRDTECDYCRGDYFKSCRYCERRTG